MLKAAWHGGLPAPAGREQPGTALCSLSVGMERQRVPPRFLPVPLEYGRSLSAAVHAMKLEKSTETHILE